MTAAPSQPVDLRSDTVTQPSAAMRSAMAVAPVGDDFFREDPTVRRLEERGAETLGTESCLFCVSGVMANEIAIAVWTSPGQEVIVEERGHPVDYELGGMAVLSGAMPRTVPSRRGVLDPQQVESAIRRGPYYISHTGLIIVENTHNMWGGTVLDVGASRAIVEVARRNGVPCHLDGARLFNAAVAEAVSPAALAEGFSSLIISLSKGLGAPVGSLLAGPASFIEAARTVRKRFGGGWRQAGILAAAGLVALDESPPLLQDDHRRARSLAEAAAEAGFVINPQGVATNIVVFETGPGEAATVVRQLEAAGVLCMTTSDHEVRMVTHRDVDDDALKTACRALQQIGAG